MKWHNDHYQHKEQPYDQYPRRDLNSKSGQIRIIEWCLQRKEQTYLLTTTTSWQNSNNNGKVKVANNI